MKSGARAFQIRARVPSLAVGAALAFLAACSGDSTTRPEPDVPAITVSGVEDRATYAGPVSITVSVDRGSFEAKLNGETIIPPRTVRLAGEYLLEVRARNGTAISEQTVRFTLAPTGSELIVRILELGANRVGGGGDAILLTDSSSMGRFHALIDAGPAGMDGADQGFVASRLATLGVDTLELLVLTHAHSDHYAGMDEVLRGVHVRRFVYNGQVRSLRTYNDVLLQAGRLAGTVLVPDSVHRYRLAPGDSSTVVTILPPLSRYLRVDVDREVLPDEGGMLNEGSVGVRLSLGGDGGFSMFLTGDGEVEANRRWMTLFAPLTRDVDVLKVGHHGANNAVFDDGFSGSSAWLAHSSPSTALISANGISHARINALTHLRSRPGLTTYCTSVHGDLVVRARTDGGFTTTVRRNADRPCVAGSEARTRVLPPLSAAH